MASKETSIQKSSNKKIALFGTDFDNITREEFCEKIDIFISQKSKLYLVTVKDVAVTVQCLEDSFLQDFYNKSDIIVVDGRGLVYAAFLIYLGRKYIKQLYGGPGGYYALLEKAIEKQYRLYYFGATQEIVERAVGNVRKRLPGINVCGCHHGYLNDENIENFLNDLNNAKPDILFVGISAKIREAIITKYGDRFPHCVCFFIGGMIDVEAGLAKFAPRYLSYFGVEWLWRAIQEPRRLGKRYLYTHSRFVRYFVQEFVRKRHYCIN